MATPVPTRFPNGFTNAALGTTLATFPDVKPNSVFSYSDDFNRFNAADWESADTAGGNTSAGVSDAERGIFELHTGIASPNPGDRIFYRQKAAWFSLDLTKETWFETRFNGNQRFGFIVGFATSGTDPIGDKPAAGIWFQSSGAVGSSPGRADLIIGDGDLYPDTILGTTEITMDVDIVLAWHLKDGVISAYFDGGRFGKKKITLPPSGPVTLIFGVQSGILFDRRMRMDYIFMAQER